MKELDFSFELVLETLLESVQTRSGRLLLVGSLKDADTVVIVVLLLDGLRKLGAGRHCGSVASWSV